MKEPQEHVQQAVHFYEKNRSSNSLEMDGRKSCEKAEKNKETSDDDTTSTSNQPRRGRRRTQYNSPSGISKLRTNRNGLPVEVQRAVLVNVVNFQGLDYFSRDTCDSNPEFFGVWNSPRRWRFITEVKKRF